MLIALLENHSPKQGRAIKIMGRNDYLSHGYHCLKAAIWRQKKENKTFSLHLRAFRNHRQLRPAVEYAGSRPVLVPHTFTRVPVPE